MKIKLGKTYILKRDLQTGFTQPQTLRAGQRVRVSHISPEGLITVRGFCETTAMERSASIGFEDTTAHGYIDV